MTHTRLLPPGVTVFERGWLSANNILLQDAHSATLVDSGYVTHQEQTLALVTQALQGHPLDQLVNTHLHSDHCGGNQALQAHYPALSTWIPPGLADAVQGWNEDALSYQPTGQNCPPFRFTGLLQPGCTHHWADMDWEVHAAPGHDPHSVILFAPAHRLLMSADALWQNGFGVVFPELAGVAAFDEVGQTLDLIERLNPATIIPGHGAVFTEVAPALALARQKLEGFARQPERHARYGTKVLIKFKLLEWGQISKVEFNEWALSVPYMKELHQRFGQGHSLNAWLDMMLDELARSGAVQMQNNMLFDA
ncbi:MBL fold metallo-hydrolase [Limnohabitans sp. 2KL-1]|jgi:glyoxylase-like metal-dependent hydrolase (beta-lactamase superfamily II)|uniref:MBL fold metallo-hydrolase n=1 Tax=Limnohabitans sp. 2KL-1 TaxID=1100699 RepID=UPI000D3B0B7D|nr:MBL fold metallo-hydrolase [Limnohabitans sp. 2KL-1]PUE46700.1 MBL fold metallo-hydrolase [Limnohabitans sp. 2KL-1]